MKVIDVSRHNGFINWEKVKADGVDGVIIRAGYGRFLNQKDSRFEENYAGAKAVGLNVGTYFYTYAKSTDEAETEADVFLEWIKGKTFELPVYFDIEDPSMSNLSKAVLTDICLSWCSKVENAGYYTGIYANVYWFSRLLDTGRLISYDKWLAHWAEKPAYDESFGGMWQYSSTGRINGINGDVDLNKMYRDYPRIIKKAGLNGFSKTAVYKVRASLDTQSEAMALSAADTCRSMGMTVEIA